MRTPKNKKDIFSEERRARILKILNGSGNVFVSELAKQFRISEMTIRRDLTKLEREGAVLRTHGGAIIRDKISLELSFKEKAEKNIAEKERIGNFASNLIQSGETIFLDTGTTTLFIAKALGDKRNLTVVTNSLSAVCDLNSNSGIHTIFLGGDVKPNGLYVCGPLTEKYLSKLHFDKAFLGTDGIDVKNGLMTTDTGLAKINQMVIGSTKEVIVVADHTKVGKFSFAVYAPLQKVDVFITSRGIKRKESKHIKGKGVKVIVV